MPLPAGTEWARMMMGPFAGSFFTANGDSEASNGKRELEPVAADATDGQDEEPSDANDDNLEEEVEELKRQIRRLENELKRQKRGRPEDNG